MDDTDAFFTQTVVGTPFTVMLGRRRAPGTPGAEGIAIGLRTGESVLTRMWQDWVVLSHADDPVGQPRRRPSRVRRVLERHALWLAVLGMGSFLVSLALWGAMLWT
ncbi:hypothetical protein ACVC7V_10690 [Hydrogenophaga sp. A37]|uniref:hypothetical protein n=1 Tax=Hydrogenophaga sp. A37 TaxID=1945864 RepID=UPI000984998C|nr:hypothetical protein [Hydrogenophaga sp. A37]OOG86684.1 hypothetical protein B0E41_05535 [Hydrogenophaga sp. A37]